MWPKAGVATNSWETIAMMSRTLFMTAFDSILYYLKYEQYL